MSASFIVGTVDLLRDVKCRSKKLMGCRQAWRSAGPGDPGPHRASIIIEQMIVVLMRAKLLCIRTLVGRYGDAVKSSRLSAIGMQNKSCGSSSRAANTCQNRSRPRRYQRLERHYKKGAPRQCIKQTAQTSRSCTDEQRTIQNRSLAAFVTRLPDCCNEIDRLCRNAEVRLTALVIKLDGRTTCGSAGWYRTANDP